LNEAIREVKEQDKFPTNRKDLTSFRVRHSHYRKTTENEPSMNAVTRKIILENHLHPKVHKAIATIEKLTREAGGEAFAVGGCVRDALLGLPIKDADIEVFGIEPAKLKQILLTAFSLDVTGASFGVYKIRGFPIDVGIPREETRTGLSHRSFLIEGNPHLELSKAARRRDFTINAIYYRLRDHQLIDPCKGIPDLKNKVLQATSEKFSEDPLRVLRGMQFIARFELSPTPALIDCCKALSPDYLARERIFEEFRKWILRGKKPSLGLHFLGQTGWIRFFPEIEAMTHCEQDAQWHPEGSVLIHTAHCLDAFARERIGDEWEDLVVGFAVLCHDMGKPKTTYLGEDNRIHSPGHDLAGVDVARGFLERLTDHRALIDGVLPLVRNHMAPAQLFIHNASDSAIRRLANRVERIDRLVRVASADLQGTPPRVRSKESCEWLLERAAALKIQDSKPKPILLGRHLIELGLNPSPQFSEILEQCYQQQLDGHFTDLESGIAYLRQIAK
jgi:tRNA nucleotidyltransferase (CCA-adding enzyme)